MKPISAIIFGTVALLGFAAVASCSPTPSDSDAGAAISKPALVARATASTQPPIARGLRGDPRTRLGEVARPRAATPSAVGAPGPIVPASWTVPDWYLDPANLTGCASNANNCTSATCAGAGKGPCVLANEVIVHRWGTDQPTLAQNTQFHSLSTETVGQESIVAYPVMVGGTNFGIVGTPILVAGPFALGVVTPKNRPTATLLQAAGFVGGGIAVGQLVVNSSKGNSRARIYKLAAGVATLTQPLTPLTFANASSFPSTLSSEDDTWTTGDTVSVYALPLLNLKELEVRGGDSTTTFSGGATWVQYVEVPDASGVVGDSVFMFRGSDNIPYLVDSTMDPYMGTDRDVFNGIDQKFVIGTSLMAGAAIQGGTVAGGFATGYGIGLADYGNLDLDTIVTQSFNGPGAGSLGIGQGVSFLSAVFVDVPAPGVSAAVFNGGTTKLDPIFLATGPFLWGPSGFNVEDDSRLQKVTANTWASSLLLTGGLSLNGTTTGYAFNGAAVGNPYTAVSPITPAALDANRSLNNPPTGAGYFEE